MAYIKRIENKCPNCGKQARYEVYNQLNGHVGTFCANHAREKKVALDAVRR